MKPLRELTRKELEKKIPKARLRRAKKRNQKRTIQARSSDKGKATNLTLDYEKWRDNPRRFDFPLIDTPEGFFKEE